MELYQPEAPPSVPVPVRPVELRATWPTLLGVVSIVMGVAGMFMGLASLMSIWAVKISASVSPGMQDEMLAVPRKWMWWTITSGLISAGVAAMLLAGGIGIAMRRRWGVRVQQVWAVVKLAWSPIVVGMAVMVQMEQMQVTKAMMAKQSASAPAFMGAMEPVTYVMMVFMLLWMIALPVASLVWLRTEKAKREISGW